MVDIVKLFWAKFVSAYLFHKKIGQHSISIDADLTVPIVWSQSHTIAKQKGNQPNVWSNHFIQTKPIYASLNLTPLTHYSTHQTTNLSHTFFVKAT